MTVGPLPATVYWRRRAIVLGAVAVVVALAAWALAAATSSAGGSDDKKAGGLSVAGTASGSPRPVPTLLSGSPSGVAPAGSTGSTDPAPTGPVPTCTDAELTVVPAVVGGTVRSGSSPSLSITIGSTASHDCSRDIGADQQELRLMHGETRIWSSDDCDAAHGSYVATFHPGAHATYDVVWSGKTSTPGCQGPRTTVPAGTYQLLARVGSKLSAPVTVTIR
jgi:hypothetical protein